MTVFSKILRGAWPLCPPPCLRICSDVKCLWKTCDRIKRIGIS